MYSAVPQQAHQNPQLSYQSPVPSHSDHPSRKICCLDRWMQTKSEVRQDEDTKRWYLTLTKLELKEIRAKHFRTVEETISQSKEETEILDNQNQKLKIINQKPEIIKEESGDMVTEEGSAGVTSAMEHRMTKVEKSLERIEQMLLQMMNSSIQPADSSI